MKQDYIQANIQQMEHDIAIQLCCLGIRHYFKDSTISDKKQHIDYIEKEIRFSNFIPKAVIDTIKQKNLKKLIQSGYKKVYNFPEIDYMMKFFDLLRTQYTFDQEQFIVSIGSGWNIPVELVIGPQVGISYMTHPQGKLTKVADFPNIERIITGVVQAKDINLSQSSSSDIINVRVNNNCSNSSSSSPAVNKKVIPDKLQQNTCNCSEIKTQLKILISGNLDGLAITCNGVKTADNIADLVDGYCKLLTDSDDSLWDRSVPVQRSTPSASATNSLEKHNKREFAKVSNNSLTENENSINSSTDKLGSGDGDFVIPTLSEDYAEIGLGEEEGDYSTPASK